MQSVLLIILLLITTGITLYRGANLRNWTISMAVALFLLSVFSHAYITLSILWMVYILTAITFNVKSFRRKLLTASIFSAYRRVLPTMSRTEREAIGAGTVTWEADLFAGRPDWEKMRAVPRAQLTHEEKTFIEGPLNTLCSMIDDWDITHKRLDMPPEVWQFIKDNGFFSFIIPKSYGGLEFSPFAVSRILIKLYGCSVTVASTVGVPNSLGPAELLLKYGTDAQKDYYLPRLAKGEEVPCFALTGLEAGSDAGSLVDTGIICKGRFKGEETLGILLNFDKRYITLAPVASLIGLAFKLYDPDHLMGTVDSYGITCALIPRETPGIEIGQRHFPVNQAFMNGPVRGKDVFIPLDQIIGGKKMAGHGWRMLMECLAAGRAVTLPSSGVGGAVMCTHATGAYARVRRQFNMPIGRFEGIEEVLARMGGYTYLMDGTLHLTLDYLNHGEKSAVAAAIAKYHVTELSRHVINDAMDVHGGKGIQMGPKNYLARVYESQPVGITVEGANILTRSMIIFGQGAIRCHPYVFAEMEAAHENNLAKFDKVFWKHIGHTLSNFTRTIWLGLTGARFVKVPSTFSDKRYYQIFTRYSAAFALFSDIAMFTLGGSLKRKEKTSARLGDILSYLYMGSGALKRFYAEGSVSDDLPLLHWSCRTLVYWIQEALHNLVRNFPGSVLPTVLRWSIFPFGRLYSNPIDQYGEQVATILLTPSAIRDRLIAGIYLPNDVQNNMGLLQAALVKAVECEPLIVKVQVAYKMGQIRGENLAERIVAAQKTDIITQEEFVKLMEMQQLSLDVIAVDEFTFEELMAR